PFAFDEISITNNFDFLIVKQKGKFGVVNFKNQIIIPIKYDQIEFDNGQQLFKVRIKNINYKLSPLNKVLSKKQIEKEID
ncbi:WG repeat-containing protein, partial [uncultured Flavobacterium sp.]